MFCRTTANFAVASSALPRHINLPEKSAAGVNDVVPFSLFATAGEKLISKSRMDRKRLRENPWIQMEKGDLNTVLFGHCDTLGNRKCVKIPIVTLSSDFKVKEASF